MKSISKDLLSASASSIVLCSLLKNDSYGYEIVQKFHEITNDKINWKESSIYPVLKKLETGGMIKSYWKMQEGERPRKYYTILQEGRMQLEKNLRLWSHINSIFNEFKEIR